MNTLHTLARSFAGASALFLASSTMTGCEKKPAAAKPEVSGANTQKHDDHDHAHDDGHDHDHAADGKSDHDHDDGHDHGATTALGEQSVSGFTIKASRDGDLKPGGDAPVDVWISGGTAKVSAMRFWIGTEDAKGSLKAKAELEKDNWHTHVEVPSPLAAGSKLWVEVETEKGEKALVSFALKN